MWEPFGTQPTNSTAYWKAAPSERGTFGILSTCILTLLLCVYTSLHLNIPVHKITKWYQSPWILRVFGVLVGLLAPELVAYLAFRQWLWARNLDDNMMEPIRKLIPQAALKPKRGLWSKFRIPADVEHVAEELGPAGDNSITADDKTNQKRNPWTRTHSHFALMGGFAFDTDDSQENFLPDSQSRLTLTPKALRKLAEVDPMLIPDLSDRAIQDKSKANWLAKALVCLQACWFIVQVAGRASTSAPISLLEMNTFLHALCCLVVYLAWWHKPLDIGEPELIKLNTDKTRKICAWMIMNSKLGAYRQLESKSTKKKRGFLVHNKDLYEEDGIGVTCSRFITSHLRKSQQASSDDSTQQVVQAEHARSASLKLYPGEMVNGFYLILDLYQANLSGRYLRLNPATLECLRLADLLRTDPDANNIWKFNWSSDATRPYLTGMVLPHISDFNDLDDSTLDGFKGSTTLTKRLDTERFFVMTLLFAGSIYGLVHLTAWNGPFTSPIQRWMWRVSCFVIASPAVVVAIALLIFEVYEYVEFESWAYFVFAPLWLPCKLIRKVFPSDSVRRILTIRGVVIILALVYLAARVYLLVECFINISQLPPEVYQVPQWSQYIPHLGAG